MCGLGSSPKIPPPAAVIPPPQASKAPEQETFKRKNVAGSRGTANSGNSGTIMTSASGAAVPQGQLGTSVLLGS
jgi:hypothetical protein